MRGALLKLIIQDAINDVFATIISARNYSSATRRAFTWTFVQKFHPSLTTFDRS